MRRRRSERERNSQGEKRVNIILFIIGSHVPRSDLPAIS